MKARRRSIWRLSSFSLASVALAGLCGCGSAPPPVEEKKAPPVISSFYASPPQIAKGERALLCYGTESADTVKLDPPVEELKPSLTRCFNVTPEATTSYTLTAAGPGGETSQTATVTVQGVKKDPPKAAGGKQLIKFFMANAQQVLPGTKITLCYGVSGAASVSLSPGGESLPALERHCTETTISQTTTYTLQANSAAGDVDKMQVTVKTP